MLDLDDAVLAMLCCRRLSRFWDSSYVGPRRVYAQHADVGIWGGEVKE
jgi:hypothetical protein